MRLPQGRFQFQTGSIKSLQEYQGHQGHQRFNSKLVRLKGPLSMPQ